MDYRMINATAWERPLLETSGLGNMAGQYESKLFTTFATLSLTF